MAARSPRLLAPGAYMMIVVTIIATVHGNVHLADEPNDATEQTRIDTLPGERTDTAAARRTTAPASPVVNVQTKDKVHPVQPITYMLAILSLTLTGIVGHMYATAGSHNGPHWDPAGNVQFRTWIREVQAWLNVTSNRMGASQQAAAIQLGLRGVAREFALTIPPAAISFGAAIEGVATDPVTYLLYTLGNRFDAYQH